MGIKEKIVVATLVSCTAAVIGYSQVYLPFYSDMSKTRREKVRQGALGKNYPGGPGSMWNNIELAKTRRLGEEEASQPKKER